MSAAQPPESWIKEICAVSCALIHTGWWWKSEKHAAAARWCVRKVRVWIYFCVFFFFLFSIPPHPAAYWRWSQHTLPSLCSVIYMSISEPEVPYFILSLLLVLYFVCGVFKSACVCSLREAAYVLVGQLKKKPSLPERCAFLLTESLVSSCVQCILQLLSLLLCVIGIQQLEGKVSQVSPELGVVTNTAQVAHFPWFSLWTFWPCHNLPAKIIYI